MKISDLFLSYIDHLEWNGDRDRLVQLQQELSELEAKAGLAANRCGVARKTLVQAMPSAEIAADYEPFVEALAKKIHEMYEASFSQIVGDLTKAVKKDDSPNG